ncbi:MAG: DUF362 domain-containing protein [Candidatus Latescibacterota bacterium]
MKRRKFLSSVAAGGAAGLLAQSCSTAKQSRGIRTEGPGFDVHPFVRNHPEAVFIHRTNVSSKLDAGALGDAGRRLARDLIVRTPSGGYPDSTRILVKPNWTGAGPQDGKPVIEKLGVNTDPHFIAGWVEGMRDAAPGKYYFRESGSPHFWEDMGYSRMAREHDIDLRDLSSMNMWELKEGDLNFVEIPDGVVFRKNGYMSPANEPDTVLISIAKLKAHGMGITGAVKNLQGLSGNRFKQFCTRYDALRSTYEKPYHSFFQNNFERRIEASHARHLAAGIPRWDRPGENGGIWMEQWCQRTLDNHRVTHPALSLVEGVYSQDGNGFGIGPHEKLGPHGVTSRDYLSNVVIFGVDPFRIDIIAHWLAGHEPGNFGLFHLAIERGFSDVLDPRDIPVYLWEDGKAVRTNLEKFERIPLVTYYLQRDYNGQTEPRFHLCDEPFDYAAWKSGKRTGAAPAVGTPYRDGPGRVTLEVSLPRREDVYVEVLNSRGERLWRLIAEDCEPGVHQVVWDGFASPGIHSFYVKGMGWDAERKVVVYG